MKRVPVLIRANILLLSVVWLFSCSGNSVGNEVNEETELNGVWVCTTVQLEMNSDSMLAETAPATGTIYWVSVLRMKNGSFTLQLPYSAPSLTYSESPDLRSRGCGGKFEVTADSLFLTYKSASSAFTFTEPYRFSLFPDSLVLYYNTDAGVHTVIDGGGNQRVAPLVRVPSVLWRSKTKMSGVFKRVE